MNTGQDQEKRNLKLYDNAQRQAPGQFEEFESYFSLHPFPYSMPVFTPHTYYTAK